MQPQSDIASRSPGVNRLHSAPAPQRRRASAPPDPAAVVTDLSTTFSQIRGLQQFHVDDDELDSQLRRTAAELESLVIHLLHIDVAGSSPPPAPQLSATTPRQRAAEQAFLVWLAELTNVRELPRAGGDEPEPTARILGELSLSRRALPTEAATSVGRPDGTTVGHAAAALLLAVKDPAGPRCRSYRAAVYHLRDLDRGRFFEPDDGKDRR